MLTLKHAKLSSCHMSRLISNKFNYLYECASTAETKVQLILMKAERSWQDKAEPEKLLGDV